MQDPFAGRERLNQLTPEELRNRNDHMSAQQPSRSYTKDATQEQLDFESRQYYRNLTLARYNNNNNNHTIDPNASPSDPNLPLQSSQTTLPVLDVINAPEKQQHPAYPLGWGERLNQVSAVDNLDTDIRQGRIVTSGGLSKREVELQLLTIKNGITALRSLVDSQMDEYMTLSECDDDTRNETAIITAKNKLKATRAQLTEATQKQTELQKQLNE